MQRKECRTRPPVLLLLSSACPRTWHNLLAFSPATSKINRIFPPRLTSKLSRTLPIPKSSATKEPFHTQHNPAPPIRVPFTHNPSWESAPSPCQLDLAHLCVQDSYNYDSSPRSHTAPLIHRYLGGHQYKQCKSGRTREYLQSVLPYPSQLLRRIALTQPPPSPQIQFSTNREGE